MSKSLIITIIATLIGIITLAVGLYILNQTPKPVESISLNTAPSALVILPKTKTLANSLTDIPSMPAERGTEAWCEEMMLKADNQWPDQDAVLFAKSCIYETLAH